VNHHDDHDNHSTRKVITIWSQDTPIMLSNVGQVYFTSLEVLVKKHLVVLLMMMIMMMMIMHWK
jgi:hypothetical protein